LGSYIQDCVRWQLVAGKELTDLVKQYGETTFLLDRLLQALVQKQQDGTWDNSYWVKEGQAAYLLDPESLLDFPEIP
jgi:hypothetical protein